MEHNANKRKENNGLISSLLKMFSMFEIRLSYGDEDLDVLYIKCINCKTETGLNPKTNFTLVYDEIVTKFVLNAMLHHVGISWIISSNQKIEYEMNKTNHQYWLNKGPCYNTYLCSKLYGSMFEDFITQARTERYNLVCYLVAHDKMQPDYEDDLSSIGDIEIPNDATIKTLGVLVSTFNFIYIWIKLLRENYCARSE